MLRRRGTVTSVTPVAAVRAAERKGRARAAPVLRQGSSSSSIDLHPSTDGEVNMDAEAKGTNSPIQAAPLLCQGSSSSSSADCKALAASKMLRDAEAKKDLCLWMYSIGRPRVNAEWVINLYAALFFDLMYPY